MVLALPAAPHQARAQAGPPGKVFTADETGASVSAIELATGQVRTVPVPIQPHNVQVTPDGARVLLVGPGTGRGGHGAGRLLALDPADIARPPLLDVPAGPHPAHVVTDAAGRRAFVTDSNTPRSWAA